MLHCLGFKSGDYKHCTSDVTTNAALHNTNYLAAS